MSDDFTDPVKRVLAARAGNRCSNPGCRALTSGPQDDPRKAVNLGVAAHITAASAGGPRYDASLSPDDRCAPSNGIWLCQNCAKLIDNDPARFTVEVLKRWKSDAEADAKSRVGKTASGTLDATNAQPLNLETARALLDAVPKERLKELQELLFVYELRDSVRHSHFPERALQLAKTILAQPVTISVDTARTAIAEAENRCRELEKERGRDGVCFWVEEGLQPLLSIVPSSSDVLARFAQLPRGEYVPFLFLEFFSEGHLRSGYVAFDILARLGVANEALLVHEQAIKYSDWHRDWEYDMAVSLAQQALGDGFEAWYSRIRGVSKAEDDEEYQRNQQKKKEIWAARNEEMAERDEESLREFQPPSTNEIPSISPKDARALRLKIQRLREQLLEINTYSDETENNVESIAFRAKHLLKRFYPHSSFRIHSHEMGARGDLLVRRRMSALRRRLEDEFEVVLDHLESVIDA